MRLAVMSREEQHPELYLIDDTGRIWSTGPILDKARLEGLLPPAKTGVFTLKNFFQFEDPWKLKQWLVDHAGDFTHEQNPEALRPALPDTGGDLFCVGRNYAKHAEELNNPIPGKPLFFMKPRASLIASGEPIERPSESGRVDYEGELALIIGRQLDGEVSEDEAQESVFAVSLMNDVTDREEQNRAKDAGKPWFRAKGRRTFAPFGPALRLIDNPAELRDFRYETLLNGQKVQDGNPALWLWSPAEIIQDLAATVGLRPGDVIATGTPAGVGPLNVGDEIIVRCDSIGELVNTVV